MVTTESPAVAILTSNPSPPHIVMSDSNDAEHAATVDVKEPLEAQMNVQAYYSVHVVEDKSITPQSVTTIRLKPAMGGLLAAEPMPDFGKLRC